LVVTADYQWIMTVGLFLTQRLPYYMASEDLEYTV